ncbi:MAG: hypothetical protein M1830_001410 [Pleopsidium flavum]|nr:MAG: hypothetical protein M1830_001410 [Pleopsidium flavum]
MAPAMKRSDNHIQQQKDVNRASHPTSSDAADLASPWPGNDNRASHPIPSNAAEFIPSSFVNPSRKINPASHPTSSNAARFIPSSRSNPPAARPVSDQAQAQIGRPMWKHDKPRNEGGTKLIQDRNDQVLYETLDQNDTFTALYTGSLPESVLKSLGDMKVSNPTAVQRACIEEQLARTTDILVRAPSGSGKTLAYMIPLLSRILGQKKFSLHPTVAYPRGLILAPTHELAIQSFELMVDASKYTGLRPCVVYGGGDVAGQLDQLEKGCDILFTTMGRLLHFLALPNVLSLESVKTIIIDEANEMNEEHWDEALDKLRFGSNLDFQSELTVWLFSSEYSQNSSQDLEKKWMANDFIRIDLMLPPDHALDIQQSFEYSAKAERLNALERHLDSTDPMRTVIIVDTIDDAECIDYLLFGNGIMAATIHGRLVQSVREQAMDDFDNGKVLILVATSALVRGLNLSNVNFVIVFTLPTVDEGGVNEYLARIGRVGRLGHPGRSLTFYDSADSALAAELAEMLRSRRQEVPSFLSDAAEQLGRERSEHQTG